MDEFVSLAERQETDVDERSCGVLDVVWWSEEKGGWRERIVRWRGRAIF